MGEGLWSKGEFPVPITRIRSHITQGLWGPSGGRPGGSQPSLSPAQAPPAQGLPVSPGRALRPRVPWRPLGFQLSHTLQSLNMSTDRCCWFVRCFCVGGAFGVPFPPFFSAVIMALCHDWHTHSR